MKKIILALIAASFCICSCTKTDVDYFYSIALGVNSINYNRSSFDPEGSKLIDELQDAIAEFENKYSANWEWIVSVSGNQSTTNADADAREKFDVCNNELKGIIDSFQSKFDALTSHESTIDVTYSFRLTRYGASKKDDIDIVKEMYRILHM